MERPFTLLGLDHLVLRVANLDVSRAFYEGVLGCKLEREIPSLGLYQFRAGRQLIDLVVIGSKLGGPMPVNLGRRNQDHFCIEITPFVATHIKEYLSMSDVPIGEMGSRYGAMGLGPSIYIEDPDGNTVELKGPPEQAN